MYFLSIASSRISSENNIWNIKYGYTVPQVTALEGHELVAGNSN